MVLRARLAALAIAAALAGCASTSEGPADTASLTPVSPPKDTTAALSDSRGVTTVSVGDAGLGGQDGDLRKSVYYEFDQYDVKPEYRSLVERHARWLKTNPKARLVVTGNTDERGTSEYNIALGQRRAESVTRMLVLLGAKAEQVEAVSFGKEKPRAACHDETAWAENRRSDFTGR